MLILVPVASHDQNIVAPHFDHLELRKAMVLFMMQLASFMMLMPMVTHDQKSHVASHFSLLDVMNAMVPFTIHGII